MPRNDSKQLENLYRAYPTKYGDLQTQRVLHAIHPQWLQSAVGPSDKLL